MNVSLEDLLALVLLLAFEPPLSIILQQRQISWNMLENSNIKM